MSDLKPEDFEQEMDEEMTVTLELDTGTVVCSILTILTVDDEDYIALSPLDDEGNSAGDDVWFYGYSENPESVKRSKEEHKVITGKYMNPWQLFYCKAYMIITLQPLRHFLATNAVCSKAYNALIHGIYRILGRK